MKNVTLKIRGCNYPMTPEGEMKLKQKLLKKYPPNTRVEIWIDGERDEITTLDSIF